jgi:hypothetical protein
MSLVETDGDATKLIMAGLSVRVMSSDEVSVLDRSWKMALLLNMKMLILSSLEQEYKCPAAMLVNFVHVLTHAPLEADELRPILAGLTRAIKANPRSKMNEVSACCICLRDDAKDGCCDMLLAFVRQLVMASEPASYDLARVVGFCTGFRQNWAEPDVVQQAVRETKARDLATLEAAKNALALIQEEEATKRKPPGKKKRRGKPAVEAPPPPAPETPPAAAPEAPPPAAPPECVICMDAAPTHLCAPCGHMCLCSGCSSSVAQCPICRTEATSIIRVLQV